MKGGKPSRVLLNEQAARDLFEMEAEVKQGSGHVQLSPAQLASWIVSRYRQTAFKRDRETIRRAHLDHRKSLQEAIKTVTSKEHLQEALALAMKQMRGQRKRRKARSEDQQ